MYFEKINITEHIHKDRLQAIREKKAAQEINHYQFERISDYAFYIYNQFESSKPKLLIYQNDEVEDYDRAYSILLNGREIDYSRTSEDAISSAKAFLRDYQV